MTKYLWLLFIFTNLLNSQNNVFTAQIRDHKSNLPIPFVHIYNKQTNTYAVSNFEGYFSISILTQNDEIVFTSIGYKKKQINPTGTYVYLEQDVVNLNEISILDDYSSVIKLLKKCKRPSLDFEKSGKAYYELITYIDQEQIELIQGYYNFHISNYDLDSLNLKAARLAVKPHSDRIFASQDISEGFRMHRLYDDNIYFPKSPLELSIVENKKRYVFTKSKLNDQSAIFKIGFFPKQVSDENWLFSGNIWIDTTYNMILKSNYKIEYAKKHPFLPGFTTDTISNVNIEIEKKYRVNEHSKIELEYIHFIYDFTYTYTRNVNSKIEKNSFHIKTKAILYLYTYSELFQLPIFKFNTNVSDYRKVNAFPYNKAFWNYNNEFTLTDTELKNERFYHDSLSINNNYLFEDKLFSNKGSLYQFPFLGWSKSRILFKEHIQDTSINVNKMGYMSNQYEIGAKIFFDVEQYQDSLYVITKTVLDPYDSFYRLPMDNYTHVFINIYFDLHEVYRLKFESAILNKKYTTEDLRKLFKDNQNELNELINRFKKETERGTNEEGLKKWNQYVYRILKVDNYKVFIEQQ